MSDDSKRRLLPPLRQSSIMVSPSSSREVFSPCLNCYIALWRKLWGGTFIRNWLLFCVRRDRSCSTARWRAWWVCSRLSAWHRKWSLASGCTRRAVRQAAIPLLRVLWWGSGGWRGDCWPRRGRWCVLVTGDAPIMRPECPCSPAHMSRLLRAGRLWWLMCRRVFRWYGWWCFKKTIRKGFFNYWRPIFEK